ncbi:alcohol dehydrogenase IV [Roridomyces roridus]|uniref:Alcohol dehydrogenase IV n=1 Tax=Roridomyces roridus TaxID=1738132 RepID=A0AAD7FR69_9AGAR|nr:alcohol dehydrogenase IV [Roridomyces roridus]
MSGSYGWTDTLKRVFYGPGCASTALNTLLDTLGVRKALIVTGKSLYTKTDVISKIEEILKARDAYAGVFTEMGEHTPIAGINACIKVFKESGADCIVSVGGGSPIDGAKAVRYHIHAQLGGDAPPPQIAIPTTLSAAEYSIGAGYTDESGNKVAVSHQLLAPTGDHSRRRTDACYTPTPLYFIGAPRRRSLASASRSVAQVSAILSFASENQYRPLVSPPVKTLGLAALADFFKYLPLCMNDPNNVQVRQKLLIAAWMSLWPTKYEKYSALGLSHALGHRLGATYGIPHGITSCLTLAPVVALQSRIASPDDKECLASALFYLHEPSTGSVDGDILKLSELIAGLVETLGLKSTLSEYKVPREDFVKLAQGQEEVVELLNGIY